MKLSGQSPDFTIWKNKLHSGHPWGAGSHWSSFWESPKWSQGISWWAGLNLLFLSNLNYRCLSRIYNAREWVEFCQLVGMHGRHLLNNKRRHFRGHLTARDWTYLRININFRSIIRFPDMTADFCNYKLGKLPKKRGGGVWPTKYHTFWSCV